MHNHVSREFREIIIFFLFNIGRNAWSIRLDDYFFFFFFLMVEGKGNEIYSKVSNKIGEDKLRR